MASENLSCPNRNFFCYVCSLYTLKSNSRNITKTVISGFELNYEIPFVPNLWYTPEIVCDYCYRCLVAIVSQKKDKNSEQHKIKYIRPTIWLSVDEHDEGSCYFCLSKKAALGFRMADREKIKYVDSEAVIRANLRTAEQPLSPMELDMQPDVFDFTETGISAINQTESASNYVPTESGCEPHFITQADFNDLVRDSFMSKTSAEIVASRLKQWNLVAPDFKITANRKRANAEEFDNCFSVHEETKIVYCNNIDSLFDCLNHPHNPREWRLFIDSSTESLKGALVHIGNQHPTVPIIYGRYNKEDYDTMKLALQLINYNLYNWKICVDLKMVAILMGVKKCYSKHQCFLCIWEGRKTEHHYTDFQWAQREGYTVGEYSIDFPPLVDPENVILPPLHIKLGVIRNFIIALLKDHPDALEWLKDFFQHDLTDGKIIKGR